MVKKNKTTAFDILDTMWDKLHDIDPTTTWGSFVNDCSPSGESEYVKVAALEKFLFESDIVFKKPNRKTIKWAWGEHALLYDVFYCEEHKFVCQSSDSCHNYIEGLTIFCPECNKDIFAKEKKDKYINMVEGHFYTPEEWKSFLRTKKFYRDFQRKENFKYRIKKWRDWSYIKYKLSLLVKKFKQV